MNDTPKFGTAGLSDSYAAKGFDPQKIAAYTASFGLTAFEYQCGRGVRLAHDKAQALGKAAAAQGITLSVHAPYYISMSSLEEDKRLHSIDYLLQSCALVKALGGRRVIFHSGSCGKQSREAALEKALDTMQRAVKACDDAGYGDCILCPETMGKVNQLGTLEEVLTLCTVDARITPCIDFGHLNARTQGGLASKADYAAVLDRITVDYYGTPTPIQQIAAISTPDPRILQISPWDNSALKSIEKAILNSDLGINPQNDGRNIRLNFPQLTEERRKELVKQIRKYAENGKVAVRNIRRDAMEAFKKKQKASEITEDDLKQAEKDLQKLTDESSKKIDELLARKEKELMEI